MFVQLNAALVANSFKEIISRLTLWHIAIVTFIIIIINLGIGFIYSELAKTIPKWLKIIRVVLWLIVLLLAYWMGIAMSYAS